MFCVLAATLTFTVYHSNSYSILITDTVTAQGGVLVVVLGAARKFESAPQAPGSQSSATRAAGPECPCREFCDLRAETRGL